MIAIDGKVKGTQTAGPLDVMVYGGNIPCILSLRTSLKLVVCFIQDALTPENSTKWTTEALLT
jgi:hypothetical protein